MFTPKTIEEQERILIKRVRLGRKVEKSSTKVMFFLLCGSVGGGVSMIGGITSASGDDASTKLVSGIVGTGLLTVIIYKANGKVLLNNKSKLKTLQLHQSKIEKQSKFR